MANKAESPVNILKALASQVRLDIVYRLAKSPGGMSRIELSAPVRLSEPAITHHFLKLVNAGVINESKAHTAKYYVLNAPFLAKHGINVDKLLR